MSGANVLQDARDLGIMVYRVGDRLRWRSSAPIPPYLFERLRQYRADLLRLLADDAGAEPSGPWRIVVESCQPRRGPIKINAATTITDPALCIEHNLVELERAVLHKNAGRDTAFTRLIDEYLQYLTACGCQISVEQVS